MKYKVTRRYGQTTEVIVEAESEDEAENASRSESDEIAQANVHEMSCCVEEIED